jgi:hypothetical protein
MMMRDIRLGDDIDDFCVRCKRVMNHNIVFDTTFCGDWAGNVWSQGNCASRAATCQDYVANNPGDFADAYWLINSVKVYEQSGASKRGLVPQPFLA